MADLLAHLAVALGVLTVASWRLDWLRPPSIVVGTGGAAIPDLSKVSRLVDTEAVQHVVGVPFGFAGLSTLGGLLLVAGLITVAFERDRWRRIYLLLVAGGSTSLLLDGMRTFADGRADQWLFPLLPTVRPPTPGLYVSSDPAVTVVAVLFAGTILAVDRWGRAEPTW